jgi:hypothetical protein
VPTGRTLHEDVHSSEKRQLGSHLTRSAPTLKIWMTPFASVAMLEKLALLKIALCRASRFEQRRVRCASRALLDLGRIAMVPAPESIRRCQERDTQPCQKRSATVGAVVPSGGEIEAVPEYQKIISG